MRFTVQQKPLKLLISRVFVFKRNETRSTCCPNYNGSFAFNRNSRAIILKKQRHFSTFSVSSPTNLPYKVSSYGYSFLGCHNFWQQTWEFSQGLVQNAWVLMFWGGPLINKLLDMHRTDWSVPLNLTIDSPSRIYIMLSHCVKFDPPPNKKVL